MRDCQGITFEKISEEEAIQFLSYNTYFFKLKSYARNYSKNTAGPDIGKYSNLDFAYLKELSILDMYLREMVLKITIDIEHFLKVKLLRDISNNEKEDGYSIVHQFLDAYPYIEDQIHEKERSSACRDLIVHNAGHYSIWNLVEILSFGAFTELYIYYYLYYPDKYALKDCIKPVGFLRNAAAHSNCLLRDLHPGNNDFHVNNYVSSRVADRLKKKGVHISNKTFNKKMSNRMIHDFVVTLYVFDQIVSSVPIKRKTIARLTDLFDNRFLAHRDFFLDNTLLRSSYSFVKSVIDILT